LREAKREFHVLLARRRVAARVIVHQHHRARPFTQRDAQRITHVELQAVKSSARDASLRAQAALTVDREHP